MVSEYNVNKENEKQTTEEFHNNGNIKEGKLGKLRGTKRPNIHTNQQECGLLYAR